MSTAAGGAQPETRAQVRILALTDLHMELWPHDYIRDRTVEGRGLALAAAVARAAITGADNAFLFDVGDAMQGGPMDDALARPGAPPHPMVAGLSAAGVDAATLGNHDFNFGLPALERALQAARYPVVLANIVRRLGATPLEDTPFLPPYALLRHQITCIDGTVRPLTLGVIGVAPPQTIRWDATRIGGALAARDAVESVASHVPEMRRAGAEIVIVLCHSGIGAARAVRGMENAAVPIADLDGVDVVLAGHVHTAFPSAAAPGDAAGVVDPGRGTLHGKPAVLPSYWGRHVGQIDLELRSGEDRRWRIEASDTRLLDVGAHAGAPDSAVLKATKRYHANAMAHGARQVGTLAAPLHTWFAMIADVPALRLVNAAQISAVRAALAAENRAGAARDLPLLSATAPLKAGGRHGPDNYTHIPAGPFLQRHLLDIYSYPNTLMVTEITGHDLRHWLERAASVFHQVRVGAQDAPLLDPAHPSYGFDVVAGVTYRIDVSAPAVFRADGTPSGATWGRILDLCRDGRPVDPSDRFLMATNSYRVGAPTGFPDVMQGARVVLGGVSCRDAVHRFVSAGPIDMHAGDAARPGWQFAPLPGTTCLFPTSPRARAEPPPWPAGTERLDVQRDGFDLYRLDFGALTSLRNGR